MKRRVLCMIMAVLMIFTLVACSDPKDPEDTGKSTAGAGNDTDASDSAPETDDPYAGKTNLEIALLNVGDVSGLSGKVYKVLSPDPGQHFYNYSGAEENEVYYEEPSDEPLSYSVYRRNLVVSEQLGIEIQPVWGGTTTAINDIVKTTDAAGDQEYYDVILQRLDASIGYATNGYLLNYYDIQSMDLDSRWWDKHIIDTFTIFGDHLYVISGDINFYDDYAVQMMLFNKNLCVENGFDLPYKSVRDGTWTMDKMFKMAAQAAVDVNGDGEWQLGTDIYGMADNYDAMIHYIYCYGLKMSDTDENGVPYVVEPNDANTNAIEELYNYFTTEGAAATQTWDGFNQFGQDSVLFYGEMLGIIPQFRSMESDFGILPMPKGNESIDGYRAYVSNGWTTVYSIPSVFTPDQAYDTGVILECLSAASKDYVTPALYDQLLQSKYIRDEESAEMLTYIMDSKVYDWAGDLDWAATLRSAYSNALTSGPSSFTTTMTASKKQLGKQLEKLANNLLGEG